MNTARLSRLAATCALTLSLGAAAFAAPAMSSIDTRAASDQTTIDTRAATPGDPSPQACLNDPRKSCMM